MRNKSIRSTRRAPRLEVLEARDCPAVTLYYYLDPAGARLQVDSDNAADRIEIQDTRSEVAFLGSTTVIANGAQTPIPVYNAGWGYLGHVSSLLHSRYKPAVVSVRANGGNDFVVFTANAGDPMRPPLLRPTVTIDGGEGDDYLQGSYGSQTIHGVGGNDTIYAGEDNDYVDAGSGNDTVNGGTGNDTLYGGSGNDVLYGYDGNDAIDGGTDEDLIFGGEGIDELRGNAGRDTVSGGNGSDFLFGDVPYYVPNAAADFLYGDAGDDQLIGGDGNDYLDGGTDEDGLYGDAGNDKLIGNAGRDGLHGGANNDVLYGDAEGNAYVPNAAADVLFGDADDDLLFGGEAVDELNGGPGWDVLAGRGDGDFVHPDDQTTAGIAPWDWGTVINSFTWAEYLGGADLILVKPGTGASAPILVPTLDVATAWTLARDSIRGQLQAAIQTAGALEYAFPNLATNAYVNVSNARNDGTLQVRMATSRNSIACRVRGADLTFNVDFDAQVSFTLSVVNGQLRATDVKAETRNLDVYGTNLLGWLAGAFYDLFDGASNGGLTQCLNNAMTQAAQQHLAPVVQTQLNAIGSAVAAKMPIFSFPYLNNMTLSTRVLDNKTRIAFVVEGV